MKEIPKNNVLDSLKESFTDVMKAPDGSLAPEDAWMFGCAYAIEFTARELYFRRAISREDGRDILRHTGGTISDANRWRKP